MSRRSRRSRGQAAKPRNPLVALARRRGQAIENPAKAYRRRPKHTKPPQRDGGFDVRAGGNNAPGRAAGYALPVAMTFT